MTIFAIDDIDDALQATKAFLWPFDLRRWAKLAFILFFIGGSAGSDPLQFGGGSSNGTVTDPSGGSSISEAISSIGGPEFAVIVIIFAVIVALGLLFMLIGSIMEFVFVESLQNESVRIRQYWSAQWGQGLRLFAFRVAFGLITLAIFGALAVLVLSPVLFGEGPFSVGLLFVTIPVGIVIAIVSGLVSSFTTMFVVPVMIVEDRTLLAGWRRFWPTLVAQWKQYVAYAVVNFILSIAVGIAATIAILIGAITLAIPLGIIGFFGVMVLDVFALVGWAVIALVIAIGIISFIIFALFVSVPIQTFLRYYALLVLGDTNDAFDVISEQRNEIRN